MIEVPGYQVRELVHKSSKTIVHRGERSIDGRAVMLKFPLSAFPSDGDIKRLHREFELGSQFHNTHVINYISLLTLPQGVCLVTEDYGAQPLKRLIQPGGIELTRFLRIAIQVAEGLSEIHRHHVVHKDINPGNIVVNHKDLTKIIDFGISSKLSEEFQQATAPNQLEGVLAYISPEQTGRMNRPLDYRTDFYSLGVTLFQLLTGELPFRSDDPLELIHCHIAKVPRLVHEVRADVPPVISAILERLLAKEAEERYRGGIGIKADLLRCLRQLDSGLTPSMFKLGKQDRSSELRISGKIYGRDVEIDSLMRTFDRVSHGAKKMVLVSGYAGVGKTALISEVQKPLTARKGFFIAGKFDQLSGSVAYSAFLNAFSGLVNNLLADDNHVIERWRHRLLDTLGKNCSVLTDLVPDLALILGPSKTVEPLGAVENRNRFLMAFRDLVSCFAAQEHPLIMFLDDLQWADASSLDLIEQLMLDKKCTHLMLIGAYRDNEVGGQHLLTLTLDNLREAGVSLPNIHLDPLNEQVLSELIADSLHCQQAQARGLARIVANKTNGNPFFAYELLKDLHRRKLLHFSEVEDAWQWDDEAIEVVDISDNVVDFMISQLRELPWEARQALKVAACMGNVFDLSVVSMVHGASTAILARDLWGTIFRGIIVPLSNDYRLIDVLRPDEDTSTLSLEFRFRHDRIQQGAYGLIKEEERCQTHLKVARALLEVYSEEEQQTHVVDIVRHLIEAIALITDPEEQVNTARLCLLAGKKAMASAAYPVARIYLERGLELFGKAHFQDHYELTCQLHLAAAEAAYLVADAERAESLCEDLLTFVKSEIERARVYEIQLLHYCTTKDMGKAIEIGLTALEMLGVHINPNPTKATVLFEFMRVRTGRGSRRVDELADSKLITDERLIATLNMLMRLALPVYYSGNRNLYAVVILKRVNLVLRNGTSPETANAYVTYGLLVGGILGKLNESYEYGKLALKLDERFGVLELRNRILLIYGMNIHCWNEHWKTISIYVKRSIEAGVQAGDLLFLSMACSVVHHFDPTLSLEAGLREDEKYLSFLENINYRGLGESSLLFRQFRRALVGLTRYPTSLSDDDFEEDHCLQTMTESGYMTGVGFARTLKLQLAYMHGDYALCGQLIKELESLLSSMIGLPLVVEICFYTFLSLAKSLPPDDPQERTRLLKVMKGELKKMRRWADHCAVNFYHRQCLMEAELARVSGDPWQAACHYRDAVIYARENEYKHHEALALELAGLFYLGQGQEHLGAALLWDAENHYRHWGAVAKIENLHQNHGDLLRREFSAERTDTTSRTTSMMQRATSTTLPSLERSPSRSLDLGTVIKSSMAISSEIKYERLLMTIMNIIIENAGAQKGALVLAMGERLTVETRVSLGKEHLATHESILLDDCQDVSGRIVRYVFRTGKTCVLAHAAAEGLFVKDPYVQENQLKSVLCTPIRHKEQVSGVLYLENNLIEDAFTEDRVELLQLLIAQAAISLENARLFAESRRNEMEVSKLNVDLEQLNEGLEQRVHERTAQLRTVQQELVEKAHQAGMAEIATSVLHNVGNILNSVITSCQLVHNTVAGSKMHGLLNANALLRENMDRFDQFICEDPKGKKLLRYYLQFDKLYQREKGLITENVSRLIDKVEAIREVIMQQQSYTSSGFQDEPLSVSQIMDDALNILANSIVRRGVKLNKHYQPVPMLKLQKNKLIHLLVNLVKNALEAMDETEPDERQLTIKISRHETWLEVSIIDTGIGMDPETLERIFEHGFTTKQEGHGFGLHSCAGAMEEMGGRIAAESEGPGKGTCFKLFFPLQPVVRESETAQAEEAEA